jgi:hypothetical protein
MTNHLAVWIGIAVVIGTTLWVVFNARGRR